MKRSGHVPSTMMARIGAMAASQARQRAVAGRFIFDDDLKTRSPLA